MKTRSYLRLVLFDIDGTLITTNGRAKEAFAQAMEEVFHQKTIARTHDFAGKTDQQIYYEVAEISGISSEECEKKKDATFQTFFMNLTALLEPNHIKVHPGVHELLTQLKNEPAVTLGLLTGNMIAGARLKLAPPKLIPYFPFGAFGSDAYHRHQLPDIALERAYNRTGYVFRDKEIVIVGDTKHDIECGRHLNVRTIAVATGGMTYDTLEKHKPDFLFHDLSETTHVVEAILR